MFTELEEVIAGVLDSASPRVDDYVIRRVTRVFNGDISYEEISNLDDREVMSLVLRSLRGYLNLYGADAMEDLGVSVEELENLEEMYSEL